MQMSNFGGTWPKYFVLQMIDRLNRDVCDSMNHCVRVYEGFFPVSFGCIAIGSILYFLLVRHQLTKLLHSTNKLKAQ